MNRGSYACRAFTTGVVLVAAVCLLLISPSLPPVNGRASAQSGSGELTPSKKGTTPPKKSTVPPKKKTTAPPKRTPPRTTTSPPMSAAEKEKAIRSIREQLVLIPGGTFLMGSPDWEAERNKDEGPLRLVKVQSFYMGKYEVTQAQWRAVMGNNPSHFTNCDQCPVEQVSWNDAQEFIRRMNAREARFTYRLPTEAEWEYACRAGTTTEFAFGNSLSPDQANFDGNYPYREAPKGVYRQKTIPIGSFQPNRWGLYDMHGNVWEWCEDWHHDNYIGAPVDGSAWLRGREQNLRVARGGSWSSSANGLRSAFRIRAKPDTRIDTDGIRVAATVARQ